MLQVLLHRLKAKAEETLSEEQAGFRTGRSTVEQIFNLRLLIEKHLQHNKDIYHNFIDFKKAFDRVWQAGLWQVMREFNFDNNIVKIIQALYDNASSAVLFNNQVGDFFKTPVGVRQGCPLSPTLFNIFLEHIMLRTLDNFQPSISINGRPLCNLRFADDIDLIGSSEGELQELTTRLEKVATSVGMEISSEKSKILLNSRDKQQLITPTLMNNQQLEEVQSFKYLGSTISRDGSSNQEVRIRIAQATAARSKLENIWKSRGIAFKTKLKLYKSLVLSILLYGSESWTLTKDLENKLQAFEMTSYRMLLRISYVEHKTNVHVLQEVERLSGKQEPLLSNIRKRKMIWFGHTVRHSSLAKTILQGTVEGGRRRGRPRISWCDNILAWTDTSLRQLLTTAQDRDNWRRMTQRVAAMAPLRPTTVAG